MRRKLIKPRKSRLLSKNITMPFWGEMIAILACRYGFSITKIAKEIDVPVSVIEDLIYQPNSYPSYKVFDSLVQLYYSVHGRSM